MMDPQDRISILLKLLGEDVTDVVLGDLSPNQVGKIRQRLRDFDPGFMDSPHVDDVLDEFERLLRFALDQTANGRAEAAIHRGAEGSVAKGAALGPPLADDEEADEVEEDQFVPSGHLQRDLNRLAPIRLAAVLESEYPAMAAVILHAMEMSRAGAVLELLPPEPREAAFRALQTPPSARRDLLDRLLRTAIDRASRIDMKELEARTASADKKLADILRAMNRKSRFELLAKMSEEDAERAARIRDQLYAPSDILRLDSRSVQKLLGRVDTATLAKSLKSADPALQEKVFANLSKRAVASLREEIEFAGSVDEEVAKQADLVLVRALMELDEKGEANFESN